MLTESDQNLNARSRTPWLKVALLGLGLAITSCTSAPDQATDPTGPRPAGSVEAESLDLFAFNSLQDWRNWADIVAVVDVEREIEIPPDEKELATGEYLIGRSLDITSVEGIWSRRSFEVEQLTLGTPGWVHSKENGRREILVQDGERMRAGGSYVVALVRKANGEWTLLSKDSVLPVAEGRISGSDRLAPAGQELVGATPADIGTRLQALPSDPLVEKYADYAPHDRLGLVTLERSDVEQEIGDYERPQPTTAG